MQTMKYVSYVNLKWKKLIIILNNGMFIKGLIKSFDKWTKQIPKGDSSPEIELRITLSICLFAVEDEMTCSMCNQFLVPLVSLV